MKVALITGVSGAIGSDTAIKFLKEDFFVVGQYNNGIENIKLLQEKLKEENKIEYFFPVQADFNTADGAKIVARYVIDNFKHADVLVSNAGADLYKLCTDTTEQEWDKIFNINAKSAFLLAKALLPIMIERKNGSIVFVSSIWGENGASMESVYSASKAALIGFSKSLAKEVSPSGITVNCICPGVIDTPMNDRFTKKEKADLISRTPVGRFGTPKEIAELIYFISNSSFITGQTITADGGFTL